MNRREAAGVDVPYKEADGVRVAPGLQVNEETLTEFRARMAREGRPRRVEDEQMLFPHEDIREEYKPIRVDPLVEIITRIADDFLVQARGDYKEALVMACASIHALSLLVPSGLMRR